MEPDAVREELRGLLNDLFELRWTGSDDTEALERVLRERQCLIDRLERIDGSLTVVRQVIAETPDLRDLHVRLVAQDEDLLRRALEVRDRLYEELRRTGEGRRVAQGYRLGLRPSPSIIDRSA
jgi:DNA-binding FrmR family transcriptional regulator